jgi:hypothetical protein
MYFQMARWYSLFKSHKQTVLVVSVSLEYWCSYREMSKLIYDVRKKDISDDNVILHYFKFYQ